MTTIRLPGQESPRGGRTAAVLGIATAAILIACGPSIHPCAGVGGEMDDYDGRALRMGRGEDGSSHYHPYGVPLLILSVMQTGLGALAAGRVVSSIASGLLVTAACMLLLRFVRRTPAVLAALAIATSEITFTNAVLASSDMPAAAFVALALLAWQHAAATARTALAARATFAAGVALGLAMACRTSSLFVAAGALPLLALVPWRMAIARITLTGVGAALGLAPHWIA